MFVGLMSKKRNLTGQNFFRLEILGPADNHPVSGRTQWMTKCICGTIRPVLTHQLVSGKTTSCGCYNRELTIARNKSKNLPKGAASKFWKGYQEIRSGYWNDLKRRAKDRNLDFIVTIEEAWDKFIRQGRRCALTGWELCFSPTSRYPYTNQQTASLDRIDSSMGYIITNIQWLHKDVNLMKSTLSQERLIEICQAIYHHTN